MHTQINQEDLTDGRVNQWVVELRANGFLSTADAAASAHVAAAASEEKAATAPVPETVPVSTSVDGIDASIEEVLKRGEVEHRTPMEVATALQATLGAERQELFDSLNPASFHDYMGYRSDDLGYTLWVSTKDHRDSFYTYDKQT